MNLNKFRVLTFLAIYTPGNTWRDWSNWRGARQADHWQPLSVQALQVENARRSQCSCNCSSSCIPGLQCVKNCVSFMRLCICMFFLWSAFLMEVNVLRNELLMEWVSYGMKSSECCLKTYSYNTCRTFKLWSIARARSRALKISSSIGGIIARPPATKKQPWRIPAKARAIARARSRALRIYLWIGGMGRPTATKKQPWRIPAKARAIARARSRALKIYWQIGGLARPPAKPKTLPWLVRCWGRTPFVSIHRSEPRTQLWSPRSASVHFSCVLVFVLEFPQSYESFEYDQYCLPLQEICPYIISILWACRSAEHKNRRT